MLDVEKVKKYFFKYSCVLQHKIKKISVIHAMPSSQDVQDQQRSLLLLKTIVTNLSLSYSFIF